MWGVEAVVIEFEWMGEGYARAEKRVADDTILDLRKRNDVRYTPNDAKGLMTKM